DHRGRLAQGARSGSTRLRRQATRGHVVLLERGQGAHDRRGERDPGPGRRRGRRHRRRARAGPYRGRGDVQAPFASPASQEVRQARLRDMAEFVVNFGFTPADYYALTVAEREAIIEQTNKRK